MMGFSVVAKLLPRSTSVEPSDVALAALNCFSGRHPAGARKSELAIALADLGGSLFDRALRAVQFSLRRRECVRRVLRRLLQRDILTFQLFDFLHGRAILILVCVQVCLRRNSRGVRLAQRVFVVLVRLRGACHFRFQLLLFVLRIHEALGIIILPSIALLQLVAGLLECALVLADRVLLKLKSALERGQPGGQPRRGRLEILHTGGSQMKRRLRFLDLFIDGFDVAREIIAVQRQRYHKIAERLAHDGSPACLH